MARKRSTSMKASFEAPRTVVPKPVSAKVQGGRLTLKLEPKSVTVISVGQ